MSSDNKRPNEFRQHRLVLIALYLGAASVGITLLVASVVAQLFFRAPTVMIPNSSIVANNPGPRELLECHDLVLEQLTQLSTKTSELLEQPLLAGVSIDTSLAAAAWKSDWKDYSVQWRDQWDLIDARCRFSELAETKIGVAYDQLAQVHEALPAMRLKYNRLLADFDKEQADELSKMRRALHDSQASIARELSTWPEQPSPQLDSRRMGTP